MQNNEQFPLVSLVSPCYNVAPYIERFLNSLISQTYKRLEIILINDGSTDKTGSIIESYIPKLEKEGYIVHYVKQENQGLAGTINNGLKLITGSYFTWPDPDDWLTPNSIEKRVTFLEENPKVALVRSNVELIEEHSLRSLGFHEPITAPPAPICDFFEKLVFVKTWFGALACMIRTDCFDKVVPNREIYVTKKGGQNWQILLPMAFKYPCWQLPDVLGFYFIRKNSHSRNQKCIADMIAHLDMCEDVIINTLMRLNVSKEFLSTAKKDCWSKKFELAYIHGHFIYRVIYGLRLLTQAKNIDETFLILKKLFLSQRIVRLILDIKTKY